MSTCTETALLLDRGNVFFSLAAVPRVSLSVGNTIPTYPGVDGDLPGGPSGSMSKRRLGRHKTKICLILTFVWSGQVTAFGSILTAKKSDHSAKGQR